MGEANVLVDKLVPMHSSSNTTMSVSQEDRLTFAARRGLAVLPCCTPRIRPTAVQLLPRMPSRVLVHIHLTSHPFEVVARNLGPAGSPVFTEGNARHRTRLMCPFDHGTSIRRAQKFCEQMRRHPSVRPGSVRRHGKRRIKAQSTPLAENVITVLGGFRPDM